MKRQLPTFTFTVLFMLTALAVIGQRADTTGKIRQFINKNDIKFIVKTDILLPTISAFEKHLTYTYSFELCFNKRLSSQATGLFSNFHNQQRQESSDQIIEDIKFFISKKKNYTGFYTGAYFKGVHYYYTNEQNGDFTPYYNYLNYEQQSFGGGLIFGFQNYIKGRLVIDFIVGFGMRHITETNIIKAVNIGLDNQKQTVPDARLGLNIGYKF